MARLFTLFDKFSHLLFQLLRRQLASQTRDDQEESVKTALLDHYLWKYAYTHRDEMGPFPYHRTITIFY